MMWGVHRVGILPHLASLALFLPVIGFLVLLFWFVQPSDPRDNAYGPSPSPYPHAA